jgi:predicted negative regulator of RcsB-dependent stress response
MAYDHEQQEQVDLVKAWFKRNANRLIYLALIVLSVYAAWFSWQYYQHQENIKAATLYEELQSSIPQKDDVKLQRITNDIKQKFSRTPYAEMAALIAAKSAFDTENFKVAKAQLQWVIDNGRSDEFKVLARIRLAGILIDEKAFDTALSVLDIKIPPDFEGLIADRRGDVLSAQAASLSDKAAVEAKLNKAREAYKIALNKTDKNKPMYTLIELKINSLSSIAVN